MVGGRSWVWSARGRQHHVGNDAVQSAFDMAVFATFVIVGIMVGVMTGVTCLARPSSTPSASSWRTAINANRPAAVAASASSCGPAHERAAWLKEAWRRLPESRERAWRKV